MDNIVMKQLVPEVFFGIDENNEKKLYYKLLEFESSETNKHYVAYTDYSEDISGDIKAYGATVKMIKDEIKLEPLENDKEWRVIDYTLQNIQGNKKENKNEKED